MNINGIILRKDNHPTRPYLVNVAKSVFGKQIRKRFKTKAGAEGKISEYKTKLAADKTPLEPEIARVVALFQDKLSAAQFMKALTEAVELKNLSQCTLEELCVEYLEHKQLLFERGTLSSAHWEQLQCKIPMIAKYLGNRIVNSITIGDIDDFVDKRLKKRHNNGKLYSPRTVENELKMLSALFNYGIKKGHMTKNPTLEIQLPDYKPKVGICVPAELEKLLEHADHHIQCHIMFGAFGGLRSSEIRRMDWNDVRLEEGQFYIHGTKNREAERWVKLTPPLMDFCTQLLESENPPKGLVVGGMTKNAICLRLEKLYRAADVRIPKNGLRHSYGSHSLVAYNNPAYTATEMGHIGPQITFKAYRKAVLKSQADQYFAIRCEAKPYVIRSAKPRGPYAASMKAA